MSHNQQPSGFYSVPHHQRGQARGAPAASWQQPPPALYNYSNSSNPQYRQQQSQHPHYNAPLAQHRHPPVETRKRPRQEPSFQCEPCQVSFTSSAALDAHQANHETCTACSFCAAPKVVKAHYQSKHGKFSSTGFKTITVAVPGCPVQRFRICVGNRPQDVQQWIADRKKCFPRQQRPQPDSHCDSSPAKREEKSGLATLLDGYGSSSSDDDAEERATKQPTEAPMTTQPATTEQRPALQTNASSSTRNINTRPCRYFMRNGSCRNGDNCAFSHDVANVQRPSSGGQPRRARTPARPDLFLNRLLLNEARRESSLTIQFLEYIVKSNYFLEENGGAQEGDNE